MLYGKLNKSLFLAFILIFLMSCGSLEKSLLRKNYDRIVSEYNTLFNGEKALEIGLKRLENETSENYFDLLSIEILPVENEFRHFDFAKSKALKVIEQNQSDEELSTYPSQVADAILLLIKARYYNNEYKRALEALNQLKDDHFNAYFPIEKYYWTAKINFRLGKTNEAIDLLEALCSNQNLDKEQLRNVKKILAEAYLKDQKYSKSVELLRELIEESKTKEQRRIRFILSQVLEISGDRRSALDAYRNLQLENKKDVYHLHSLFRLFTLDSIHSTSENILVLENLKTKFSYRKYDHYINHYLGKLYLEKSDFESASRFFTESEKSPNIDIYTSQENQKFLYHLYLSTQEFDKAAIELKRIVDWQHPNYHLEIQKTRLSRLIFVEKQLKKTDSLLTLSNIDLDEIRTIFDTQIIVTKPTKIIAIPSNPEKIKSSNSMVTQKSSSQKPSFLLQWGNRPNVDNWRNSQLLGSTYQNNPDITSDTPLTESEKLILWNDFLASIESIKNNKFSLEQQYVSLFIEQIDLYLWFGLFEDLKILINESRITLTDKENDLWLKKVLAKLELNDRLIIKNYYIAENRI